MPQLIPIHCCILFFCSFRCFVFFLIFLYFNWNFILFLRYFFFSLVSLLLCRRVHFPYILCVLVWWNTLNTHKYNNDIHTLETDHTSHIQWNCNESRLYIYASSIYTYMKREEKKTQTRNVLVYTHIYIKIWRYNHQRYIILYFLKFFWIMMILKCKKNTKTKIEKRNNHH